LASYLIVVNLKLTTRGKRPQFLSLVAAKGRDVPPNS